MRLLAAAKSLRVKGLSEAAESDEEALLESSVNRNITLSNSTFSAPTTSASTDVSSADVASADVASSSGPAIANDSSPESLDLIKPEESVEIFDELPPVFDNGVEMQGSTTTATTTMGATGTTSGECPNDEEDSFEEDGTEYPYDNNEFDDQIAMVRLRSEVILDLILSIYHTYTHP